MCLRRLLHHLVAPLLHVSNIDIGNKRRKAYTRRRRCFHRNSEATQSSLKCIMHYYQCETNDLRILILLNSSTTTHRFAFYIFTPLILTDTLTHTRHYTITIMSSPQPHSPSPKSVRMPMFRFQHISNVPQTFRPLLYNASWTKLPTEKVSVKMDQFLTSSTLPMTSLANLTPTRFILEEFLN